MDHTGAFPRVWVSGSKSTTKSLAGTTTYISATGRFCPTTPKSSHAAFRVNSLAGLTALSYTIAAAGIFVEFDPQTRPVRHNGIAVANFYGLHNQIVYSLMTQDVTRQRAVGRCGARVKHGRIQHTQFVPG